MACASSIQPCGHEKYVFAHYMLCCSSSGHLPTVEQYKDEIRRAQSFGIDGFALNAGGWQTSEPIYKVRAARIYEAARKLNSGFKLFMSADGRARVDIVDMVSSFASHPNQLRCGLQPVVSTFGGESEGAALTQQVHAAGGMIIPYYRPSPISILLNGDYANYMSNTYPDIDGAFYFGAAASPDTIASNIISLSREMAAKGKILMAGITPYYRGNGKNFRLFDTDGFEGMAKEWQAAIDGHSNWVEIVTWNDWAESTYVEPLEVNRQPELWDRYGRKYLPHNGYLQASKYFIQWFKSGAKPKILRDELYYFYRLHSKDIAVPIDITMPEVGKPKGYEGLSEKVFISTFLTAPAILNVDSGGVETSVTVDAGVHNIAVNSHKGHQRFRLIRGSSTIFDKVGEYEITDNGDSRFNYFSGSASD